ncbi:MAG: guanylate kinase [Candidatus Pacebacteria bacterium]|nr:guanylate kinase [Candidatus Paceibacterota bacterium]
MGTLILIVGLPGSGKGTLIKYAREVFPDFIYPASWTTRAMRPGEVEGEVYHFATKEEFDAAVERGEFLEWVTIDNGSQYGTLKKDFIEPLKAGKHVLRELEVEGARAMRSLLPEARIVSIFLPAGTWEDLEARMLARAPMSEEELAARKARYEKEVAFEQEADHVLKNEFGKLDETKQKFEELIRKIVQN